MSQNETESITLLDPIVQVAGRWWFWPIIAIFLYAPWIDTEVGQGNVASDLAAIESLVERLTFFINDSPFVVTLDKFKRDDLYFSQKSPIFHLVGAVPIWILTRLGYGLAEHPAAGLRVLTLLMVIMPMGWLLGLIYRNPWMAQLTPLTRFLLTLAFALGTLLAPFSITFNHYIPAAAVLMAAVNSLLYTDPISSSSRAQLLKGLRIGALISLSIACDITPGFLFGIAVAGYMGLQTLRGNNRLPLMFGMALGALPIALTYAALNVHIVGSPLPPNMHESEMLYYEGSFWAEQQAKIARGEPDFYEASYPRRIFHALLGYKGIYWMMPLLALATIVALKKSFVNSQWRIPLFSLALYPPVLILVVMRWALDHGGGQYGIRHVLPAVAPLYCVFGFCGSRFSTRTFRFSFITATIFGMFIAGIGMLRPWSHNTLSAFPPLENLARLSLSNSESMPTAWIGPVIDRTSVMPANAWLDLGLEFMNQKKLPEAESALRHATTADTKYALAYYHLGIALDMQNRPRDAMAIYDQLLKLEPENFGAWNNLGIFALRAGDASRAREVFTHSLERVPDNATSMWGLLILEQMDGTASPDSPLLRRAMELHPGDARIQDIARKRGK